MYAKQPKKLMIINILDILRRYTDKEHRLSQKEIAEILKNEYQMKADRKAVKRNLMNLIDFGYDIEYNETIRMTPNAKTGELEESYILSDFYLRREFDDSELRLLIDSLLFSRHIPYSQCKALVEKLEGLSNIYFRSRVKHIATLPNDKTDNKQIFLNIELLDEAISHNRKVVFKYAEYGTDKKMHPKKQADGTERQYVVSPYQMVAKEGKYYLICNYDPYNDISNYRLDHIRDLSILDEPAKPFETLQGANGQRLNLAEYMKEHLYMFSGEAVRVKFWITKRMIGEAVELFGKEIAFSDETADGVAVTVHTNELSAEQFAKTYIPDVVLLEPQRLAERVRNCLKETVQRYKKNDKYFQLADSLYAYFVSKQLYSVRLDCINEDLLNLYDIIQSRKNCDDWSDFGIRVVDDAPDIIAQFSKLTESVQYALFYPPFVEGCIEALILLAKCPVDFGDLEPIRQAALQAVSVFHTHISHSGISKEMKEFADAEYRKFADPLEEYYALAGFDSEELWHIHDDLGNIYENILNGNAVNVEKATDRIHRLLEIVEPIQGAPFYPIAVQECMQVLFLLVKCPLDFGDLEPIRQAARLAYYNIYYNL